MVSRTLIVAVVVIAIVVVSLGYYVTANSGAGSANVYITITPGGNGSGNGEFYPDNFTVKQGQHVTLTVDNSDQRDHELAIPEFNVNTGLLPSGDITMLTFTATKAGTFQFIQPTGFCTGEAALCDSSQQLNGTMTVTP